MSPARKKKLEAGLEGLFSKSGQAVEAVVADPPAEKTPVKPAPKPAAKPTAKPAPQPDSPPPPPAVAVNPPPVEPVAAPPPAAPQPRSNAVAKLVTDREEQVVVFKLGDEYFAVEIGAVESIIKTQDITVVPHAPACVEGVTNLRGLVLPVVNMRHRFGMPHVEPTKDTRIVVVEVNDVVVGFVVDAVTEVLRIPEKAIDPPSPLMLSLDSAFIRGIGKVNGRLITLLELGKVLIFQDKTDTAAFRSAN